MAYKRALTLVLLIAGTLSLSGGEVFAVSAAAAPAAVTSPAATQPPVSTPGSTGTTTAPETPLPQTTPIEPPNNTAPQTAPATNGCTFNGKPISCSQAEKYAGGIFGGFLIIFIGFFILSILTSIFWILMLVHAAKHPIEDKPLWIVVLALTGFVGAIVYYYVVKRPYDKHPVAAPTAWQPPAGPSPPVPPVASPAPQPTVAPAPAPVPSQSDNSPSEAQAGIDASQFHS